MLKFIKAEGQLYNIDRLTNVKSEQNRIEISFNGGLARIENMNLESFIKKLNDANKDLIVLDLDEAR